MSPVGTNFTFVRFPFLAGSGNHPLFSITIEKWMVAEVHTTSDFSAEPPRLLFESYFINIQGLSHFVGSDGKRQLMIKPQDQDPSPKSINVILNLLEELKYEQKEKK